MRTNRRKFIKTGITSVAGVTLAGNTFAFGEGKGLTTVLNDGTPVPRLSMDFGPCPRQLEPFLRWMIENRTASGLNRVNTEGTTPNEVTIYRPGAQEDANVAWIGAAAYKYPWSRWYKNTVVRQRACALMDALTLLYPKGEWDDGGLNAYFGIQSFAWATLEWKETGDIEPVQMKRWIDSARLAAEHAMLCDAYGPYRPSALTGQYANPEMYYLSGLAAVWKLTGEEKYRKEAARTLQAYNQWLFPGGGMAYFTVSAPQHGYQHMAVKSIVLYYDLTGDELALDMLRRLSPYFPNVQQRSGLMTDAEQPQLKHTFANHLNPAGSAMIACLTGDGTNRWAADIAVPLQVDGVEEKNPSFNEGMSWGWYNYHATTYAATAMRIVQKHPLPAATPLPSQRVFLDGSFRGVRSQWDDFAAATATRPMTDSQAGAYLADPREPIVPLGAAVDGIYFEVLRNWGPAQGNRPAGHANSFRCVEWNPVVYALATDGFAAQSCISRMVKPYWGDMPGLAAEMSPTGDFADWTTLEHWAVWRDHLIGLGAMRCHANGGDTAGKDVARIRWRLSPAGRVLHTQTGSDSASELSYGGLQIHLKRLAQQGNFRFTTEKGCPKPYADTSPVLERNAPWVAGDYVYVATDISPVGSSGQVLFKTLFQGAASMLVEPEGRKAYLWIVNLERFWRQYLWDLPAGVTVKAYKWEGIEMPPIPPGKSAHTGLLGGESTVWVMESAQPLPVQTILDSLRAGKGRWGNPPV